MKIKHPLSVLCAYTMLGALVVFGLAGLLTKFLSLLPEGWHPPILQWAPTAIVVSLACAFVAAAIASMRSAWHAERALQAGAAHRRIFWLAVAYTTACIIIEVAIGKVGAKMIGAEVNTFFLTALLTFFALAPRIVAWILSGMDGIAREADDKADDKEHIQRLDMLEAGTRAANARIEAGNVSRLDDVRRTQQAATLGAGLLAAMIPAAGAVSDATASQPALEPVATASTLEQTADGSSEFGFYEEVEAEAEAEEADEAFLPASVVEREALAMLKEDGRIATRPLAERLAPYSPTGKCSQSTSARRLTKVCIRNSVLADAWRESQGRRSHHPARRA